jgi:hypothetical protein
MRRLKVPRKTLKKSTTRNRTFPVDYTIAYGISEGHEEEADN